VSVYIRRCELVKVKVNVISLLAADSFLSIGEEPFRWDGYGHIHRYFSANPSRYGY